MKEPIQNGILHTTSYNIGIQYICTHAHTDTHTDIDTHTGRIKLLLVASLFEPFGFSENDCPFISHIYPQSHILSQFDY